MSIEILGKNEENFALDCLNTLIGFCLVPWDTTCLMLLTHGLDSASGARGKQHQQSSN